MFSVEDEIRKLKAMQVPLDEQVRNTLGLFSEEVMGKVLGFETTEAFIEWRKKSPAAPPCIAFNGRIFYVLNAVRDWLPQEFKKQNAPEPLSNPAPQFDANKRQETREEFVPPPQRRDYGKERPIPMDLRDNKYEAAREEKLHEEKLHEEKARQAREQSN